MIQREKIKPGDKFYVLYANSNQVTLKERVCDCVIETHNKDYDRKFIQSTTNTQYSARFCFKTGVDLMLFMAGKIKETWGVEIEVSDSVSPTVVDYKKPASPMYKAVKSINLDNLMYLLNSNSVYGWKVSGGIVAVPAKVGDGSGGLVDGFLYIQRMKKEDL